jgi:hypothetical protein
VKLDQWVAQPLSSFVSFGVQSNLIDEFSDITDFCKDLITDDSRINGLIVMG